MGRITTKDCMNIEGEKLKLTINTTSEDSMVVDLVNVNYTKDLWSKIKTFVMLLMFIGLSSSLNFTNVFILVIAVILLLVNLFLLVQLVHKGKSESWFYSGVQSINREKIFQSPFPSSNNLQSRRQSPELLGARRMYLSLALS